MGERTHKDAHSTRTIDVAEMPYMPATVHDHTTHNDGMTLHTIDPDPDSDIEVYDDERPAHRTGNPPE